MCVCKDMVRWGHVSVDIPCPCHMLSPSVVGPSEPSRERVAMSVGKGEGGVGLRPIHAARKVSTEAVDCVVIGAHEPRGVLLDANTLPAPTEGTTSIKLIGMAKKAAAAEPK